MKLHKAWNAAAVLAGVAGVALCSSPVMASDGGLSPHYGLQYYDHYWFSYDQNNGDDNNGDDNNNYNNDNDNNYTNDDSTDPPIIHDSGGDPPPCAVPEPGTLALGLGGLAGLLVVQLRRRRSA